MLTTSDDHDGKVLADGHGIKSVVEQVSTDGAYDHRHCYDEIAAKGAKAVVPPREAAKSWQHGNCKVDNGA